MNPVTTGELTRQQRREILWNAFKDVGFQISRHAQRRIRQRNIPPECLYDAIFHGCRRRRNKQRNREIRFDRASRWAVAVDPFDRIVTTSYRLNKRQVRFLNESAKRG